MICHYCQKNVPYGAAFCPTCGHRTLYSNTNEGTVPAEQEVAKNAKARRRITLKQIIILALIIICVQVTIGLILRFVQNSRLERYRRQLEVEQRIDEQMLQGLENDANDHMQRELNRVRNSNRESRSNYGGQW